MVVMLEEWLMVVEYILVGGNKSVVLCEWGICIFVDYIWNMFDLFVVLFVK